jgi:hypothetical protein
VKRNITVARVTEADAGLERIKHLAQQLAPAPVNSHQHRRLSAAIRFEAAAYRKSLDADQAGATHDGKLAAVGRGSFNGTFASQKASLVAHPGIYSRKHSAPRAEHKTVPMPVVARRVHVPLRRVRKPLAKKNRTKRRSASPAAMVAVGFGAVGPTRR